MSGLKSTTRGLPSSFGSIAYLVCICVLIASFVALLVPGFAITRLWEDEAYNLSVPLSVARGDGYSSFGVLIGSVPTSFDFRISTGPVVLLPIAVPLLLGVDPVLAGRGVMAAFAVLLAVAAFAVGRQHGGRWGGAAAVGVVLAFNGGITDSPVQGLTDVLGEMPAAAFTLLAIRFLRSRPWLAGLFVGIAIQCKNLAVLSVPALLVVLVITMGPQLRRRLLAAGGFIGTTIIPTTLFESAKLIALGRSAYVTSTRDSYYFLRSGGQSGFDSPPLDKVRTLLAAWGLPIVVVLLLVVGLVVLSLLDLRTGAGTSATGWLLAALLFGSWVGWWLVSIHQPVWIRHPSPGVLAVGALVAGLGVGALRAVGSRGPAIRTNRPPSLVILAGTLALVALGWSIGARVAFAYHPVGETLADQRTAAALVDGLPGDRIRGDWGPMVPIALLADRPPVLAGDDEDTSGIWLLPVWRDLDREELARAGADRACGAGSAMLADGYVYCSASN
ncbi:glycosyltransferase family 39 protein [Naasia lichenicola]|uniref:DUF2029 domain-containing protein n=1 Tax=Naasia lichenicola TaxID=2565933 RepID=A0A4S4FKZ8_9MICO|nr:glycosyltransferase family 39 protein [Naasia lichenicola]THG30841.1 hypothetical protein E6C64_09400 [Naasia lichenicola]